MVEKLYSSHAIKPFYFHVKTFNNFFYTNTINCNKACMNRLSTFLVAVAFLLIGLLFYLHFTHVEELKKVSVVAEKNAHTTFKIAYFDPDSLQVHYDYCRKN